MPTDEKGKERVFVSPRIERHVATDHVLLRAERGQARVEFPAPSVVVIRWEGHLSEGLARAATAEVEPVIERAGIIDLFTDANTTLHDPAQPNMRPYMDAWMKRWGSSFRSVHVFVGSKVVSMALTVSNMLVGGFFQIYSQRAAFEAALRAAVRAAPPAR
jgi:hypothetical protein